MKNDIKAHEGMCLYTKATVKLKHTLFFKKITKYLQK